MDDFEKEIAKEVVTKVPAKEIIDIARPIIEPTVEIIATIPRAINAALEPVHKWISLREYNKAELKKILSIKLSNVHPEMIVPPEPYIAVPAIQAISYCMDNELLRNMYANLLASSMNIAEKNSVHPSYIEIIKQLTPDEAKLLKFLPKRGLHEPIINIFEERPQREGIFLYFSNFSLLGWDAKCDFPENTPVYINNLCRLGLAEIPNNYLAEDFRYDRIRESQALANILNGAPADHVLSIQKSEFGISDFGLSFRNVCIDK